MITGKQVYELALNLIDEVSETGDITPDNPAYYESKARHYLTILQAELLPLSVTPEPVTDLANELKVNNRIALQVLPYGLAAHLMLNEDQNASAFFNARYDELKRKRAAAIQPISDVYGITDSPKQTDSTTTEPISSDSVYDGGGF